MGLDTVELVMAVEKEFRITIPNEAASRLQRLSDFQDRVLHTLEERGESADPSNIWQRLKRVVIEQCAVEEHQVVPDAHIIYDLGLD